MVEVTYVLNTLVCLFCTGMLFAAWRRGGGRLIFLSMACFALLTLNNGLIFVDVLVVPDVDLGVLRAASALAGFGVLLFGLIWEAR
jgi:hypothetical protein